VSHKSSKDLELVHHFHHQSNSIFCDKTENLGINQILSSKITNLVLLFQNTNTENFTMHSSHHLLLNS